MTHLSPILLGIGALALLTGCERGPSEDDMAGCAVRRSGPPISSREVADCAVERGERAERKAVR